MSRTGKLPVIIPDKVNVLIKDNTIAVEGPKGKLERYFDPAVSMERVENAIEVKPSNSSRFARAMQGTARSIINGMVQGVVEGFSKKIEISGVGFRAAVKGRVLDLNLGFSHPIAYAIPENINITVTQNTNINVEGVDKQLVGQVAASIKSYYPVEPYKGKGVRIIGEFVHRKEGKKTA